MRSRFCGSGIALCCGAGVPQVGLGRIGCDALAEFVHPAEIGLRFAIALCGGEPVVIHRCLVAADARARLIEVAEICLGGGIPLIGCQLIPGEGFVQVLCDTDALFVEFSKAQLCDHITLFSGLSIPSGRRLRVHLNPGSSQITVTQRYLCLRICRIHGVRFVDAHRRCIVFFSVVGARQGCR